MGKQSDELKFLLKHSSVYGIGTAVNRAVAFALLPLYTRFMTPTDYGILELIDATTSLIAIVVGLGVTSAISRFYYDLVDDNERRKFISTVFVMVAALTGPVVLVAVYSAPLFSRLILDGPAYAFFFQLAFAGLFLGVFVDLGQSYLRLLYKSQLYVFLSVLNVVATLGLNIYLVVYEHLGALGILYSSLLTRLLLGVPLVGAILYRTGLRFNSQHAAAVLKYSWPLIPSTLAMALFNYSDRFFIKHYLSIADAGVYGLANKIGGAFHSLITGPFILTFLPRRFEIAGRDGARQVFASVFNWFSLGMIFLSVVVAVFVDEIMVIMTTGPFLRAGTYVPPILLATLVFGLKYHVDFGILYSKKTHYYMYANLITSVVQVGGGWLLIRSFGLWGAVLTGLLSVSVNTALLHRFASQLYRIPFDFERNAKILTIATIVYVASRFVPTDYWGISVLFKLTLLAGFVMALISWNLVSPSEISAARALTSRIVRRFQLPSPARP